MHNLNKKGLADIVAVSLLIMLSVAAVALVFGIVNNLTVGLAPAFECTQNQLNGMRIESACVNEVEDVVEVVVHRPPRADGAQTLSFTVNSGTDEVNYACGGEVCGSCYVIEELMTNTYYLPITSLDGSVTLVSMGVDTCLLGIQESVPAC